MIDTNETPLSNRVILDPQEHSETLRIVYKVEGTFPVSYHRGVVRFSTYNGGQQVPCQGNASPGATRALCRMGFAAHACARPAGFVLRMVWDGPDLYGGCLFVCGGRVALQNVEQRFVPPKEQSSVGRCVLPLLSL